MPKSKRRTFSEREIILTLLHQGAAICCDDCGEPITIGQARIKRNIHRDHFIPLAIGGSDTPENCRYLHAKCHKKKTDGKPHTTLGSDKHAIAKVKRLRGETKKKKKQKIPGRPFQKGAGARWK